MLYIVRYKFWPILTLKTLNLQFFRPWNIRWNGENILPLFYTYSCCIHVSVFLAFSLLTLVPVSFLCTAEFQFLEIKCFVWACAIRIRLKAYLESEYWCWVRMWPLLTLWLKDTMRSKEYILEEKRCGVVKYFSCSNLIYAWTFV